MLEKCLGPDREIGALLFSMAIGLDFRLIR